MSEQRDDLVEPEGVNAGSADATAESEPRTGDVLQGGRPEDAPRRPDAVGGDEEMVGAAGTTPTDPSQVAAPPGQDSGSAG
jgi:hypothetical protein